ncbi:MAG: hypothetical protein ACD_79C00739G0017 [uncultured bacterium]|nr:MAG: hypothetical protein ACD_79C00739G0017 [uncultured bacterium]
MNKKILGIIIAVIVVIVAGTIVLKKKGIEPIKGVTSALKSSVAYDSPAKYLTNDTVMVYSLSDLKTIWKQISASKFYNNFINLKLWTDFGVKENFNKVIASFEEKIGMPINESTIMDLFGSQIIVGLSVSENTKDVKLVIQAYVGKATQIVEGMFKSAIASGNQNITTADFENEKITVYMPKTENEIEMRYALVNNILIFTLGKAEDEMKNVINLIKEKNSESLLKNTNYNEALKLLSGDNNANSFYFADFTKITPMVSEILKPLMEAQPEQFAGMNINDIAKNLEQIKFLGGKAYQSTSGIKLESYVSPNFDKMDDNAKKAWKEKGGAITVLKMIPNDALLLNATANLNLTRLWEVFNAQSEANQGTGSPLQTIMASLKQFETNYGIDLNKDIIANIGNEMSFVFSGIGMDAAVPIPRLALILKSGNPNALRENLTNIINKALTSNPENPLPITVENKNNVTVLKTPLGEGLSPIIGTIDTWMYISTNQALADKMAQTFGGKSPDISQNALFKESNLPGNGKSSQLNFIDLSGLNDLMQSLINWVIQRKDMIPQAGQFNDIINTVQAYTTPFLECFKVFKSLSMSTWDKDDNTVQEMNLIIKDLQ